MIKKLPKKNTFVLSTKNTSYVFRIMETGQAEHLYYGPYITVEDPQSLFFPRPFAPGNAIAYSSEDGNVSLEDICLEFGTIGKGDIREPMIEAVSDDGSTTLDFVYESDQITSGKPPFATLPGSYDEEDNVECLTVSFRDKNHGYLLELKYFVYADCDVITRCARFVNDSEKKVILNRMLSASFDLPERDLIISNFTGAWTNEMNRRETVLSAGKFVNSSFTGTSSNRANPFVMFARRGITEIAGDVFGMNLIYSGNHYSAFEVNSFGKTRVVTGINPMNFSFTLEPGGDFEAPEAVFTFSRKGYEGMSRNMHAFVKKHIVRGFWRDRERPILLNSWEANYFDIDEGKLVGLAKKAREVGIELFVMDDGWFGTRDDDTQSLGDWEVNTRKLPNGLSELAQKIKAQGLSFGIWIEPEMVNVNSNLYRLHPEWSIDIPGKAHSEGRTQRLLDFANPEVVSYIAERMKEILSSAEISYVKWDMNRIFSDYYSRHLPPERQGEVAHRYVMGFYSLAKQLTEAFPEILFEGCASGGNRFDLGALCFFPQIWASDNTDCVSRLSIQTGYSYGYPQSTFTAHVSGVPNHQTLRVTSIDTRFSVAAFGVLGYECNLSDMKKDDLAAIAEQTALYKRCRSMLQFGDFHRIEEGNNYSWVITAPDKSSAVCILMQKQLIPSVRFRHLFIRGLDPDTKYRFYSLPLQHNVKVFGDLVNTVAPIHVKQDSFIHGVIARLVHMDENGEELTAYGNALNEAGVNLKDAYAGVGYNEDVATIGDFSARLYFIEAVQ